MSGKLVRYEAMCRAIVEAHAVDEVKKIRDQAAALEAAAKVAKNKKLEDRLKEIRRRAEIRWGELYTPDVKAKAGRPAKNHLPNVGDFDHPSLKEMGVSERQSVEWQELAAIPEPQREAALINGTIDGLLKSRMRNRRESELAERTTAAAQSLGEQLYNVIYADPPWRFEPYSRDTGMDRAADNHYPTLDLEQIKRLEIPAAQDCVLFLWATAPMLPHALDVIKAWGFEYKTHCIWVKEHIGTGYWFRSLHEPLLVATRGNVPAPPSSHRLPSVFHEPAGRHSEKPPAFAEFIEAWFPHLPKLEMFARAARPGWDVWGNEVA